MESKFKKGDRVCIPETKQGEPWSIKNDGSLSDYKLNYFTVNCNDNSTLNVGLYRADHGLGFNTNSFCDDDLVLYGKKEEEVSNYQIY